jgi:hypothetical protein
MYHPVQGIIDCLGTEAGVKKTSKPKGQKKVMDRPMNELASSLLTALARKESVLVMRFGYDNDVDEAASAHWAGCEPAASAYSRRGWYVEIHRWGAELPSDEELLREVQNGSGNPGGVTIAPRSDGEEVARVLGHLLENHDGHGHIRAALVGLGLMKSRYALL